MAKKRISDEEFVREYSQGVVSQLPRADVAKKLGMSLAGMSSRATKFRKVYSVNLPKFPKLGKKKVVDTGTLNRIIDKIVK